MGAGVSAGPLNGEAVAAHVAKIGAPYGPVAASIREHSVDEPMLLLHDDDAKLGALLDDLDVTDRMMRRKLKAEFTLLLRTARGEAAAVAGLGLPDEIEAILAAADGVVRWERAPDAPAAPPPRASAPETAEAKFAAGVALKKERKWADARAAFRAAVEKDPKMVAGWYELGVAEHEAHGRVPCEASYDPFARCAELDPTHVRARVHLARVLRERKDYDGAERVYRECLRIDPRHSMAHNNLGWLLHDARGDLDGAERMYREAIRLNPRNVNAHWNLSLVLERRGEACPRLEEKAALLGGATRETQECIRLGERAAPRGSPVSADSRRLAV